MKTINKILLAFLLMSLSQLSFAGGPWLLEKNKGFVQAQAILPVYQYSSLLMGNGISKTQATNRKVHNSDYGIYLEYGLSNRLNLITKIPFKYVSTGELTEDVNYNNLLEAGSLFGMSNYELDLKWGIIDKKVKIAVSANTLWNTISKDLDKGLATGFDANAFGATVHIGRSTAKHYGFVELGYRKFTHGFSDMLRIKIEHGWKLGEHFYLAAALDANPSLQNGTFRNENLEQTGLYPNNQESNAISIKVAYETEEGWGANVAVPIVPIRLKYIGYNGTLCFGVYRKF